MTMYSHPNAEKIRRLKAEVRYEIDKARVERRYSFAWGFGYGFVCALALTVVMSL